MKKFLTIASVAAVSAVTVMGAIEWNGLDNYAKGATAVASSHRSANEGPENVVDDNNGTRWQSTASTHANTTDWVLIDLGENKAFNTIEIEWEASHATAYDVYVSSEAIDYTTVPAEEGTSEFTAYNKIADEWFSTHTALVSGTDDTEVDYTATHSFDEQTARYILINCTAYNNWARDYGTCIKEVRVTNLVVSDDAAKLNLTSATAVAGEEATVTVTATNVAGNEVSLDKVTDLTLTAPAAVTVTPGTEAGTYTVKADKAGVYTLTATAKAGENTLTAEAKFTVSFNWTGVENVATGKTILGRNYTEDNANDATKAVDGDAATYYQYNGEWGGGDGWLFLDLGADYFVDAIGADYGETSNGRVTIGYSLDRASFDEFIEAVPEGKIAGDKVMGNLEGFTFTSFDRLSNSNVTAAYDSPVKARYIIIKDADNPQGRPQVKEILVKGTEIQAAKADAITINLERVNDVAGIYSGLFPGETAKVSASVVDQYGEPFAGEVTLTAEGGTIADGVLTPAEGVKQVIVTATCGDVTETATVVVANVDDYCMVGATVTSDNAALDGAAAIDGGKNPDNEGALYILQDGGAKDLEHWILAELAKPYDLDMIIALWEGAAPAAYDVYVGETEDALDMLYTVSGREGTTHYNDRFAGKEMKNVKFIKIATLGNSSQYGCKLKDLKAYGTSNAVSVATELTLTADNNNIATDEEVKLTAAVVDQFGAPMENMEITYACNPGTAAINNGTFKAETPGTYTVTATCGELSAEVDINVVADAEMKATFPRTLDGEDAAIDGELQLDGEAHTIVYDLGKAYNLQLIKLRWETANPKEYTVTVTYDDDTDVEVFSVSDRQNSGNITDRIAHNGTAPVVPAVMAAPAKPEVATANLNGVKKVTIKTNGLNNNNNWQSRLFGVDFYGYDASLTGIDGIAADENAAVDVYNMQGVLVRKGVRAAEALEGLPAGIYVAGGRKVIK